MKQIIKSSVTRRLFAVVVLLSLTSVFAAAGAPKTAPKPAEPETIKAYCLDFNWAGRRGNFAPPGTWKNADPKVHVAWHKAVGSNVIQTFAVSSNGWAWYKGGPVPVQPGLKHDFLREVVKLGHAEGMCVIAYFCVAANTRWGQETPELSYGTPSTYHIPYTDKYLAYLAAAVGDAVKTTGIDGIMLDWVWQPKRQSTKGKWIDAEKKLYEQLMGEPFPGEDKLTRAQDVKYSRMAIDRCWKTIQKAAKTANPNCILWLTSNHLKSPHVINSDMYRQADWVMGEAGRIEHIEAARKMVGKHTRLITCMALWNRQDPTTAVPMAMKAGIGLYGFAKPGGDGTLGLNKILPRQISELTGDAQSIAVLARAYHGVSPDALWVDGKFVEPKTKPPFRIRFKRRGRGWQDTARIEFEQKSASVTIRNPYQSGRAELTRTGAAWPGKLTIRLLKRNAKDPKDTGPKSFRMANGKIAFGMAQGEKKTIAGKLDGQLEIGKPWGEEKFLNGGAPKSPVTLKNIQVNSKGDALEIIVPSEMTSGNPASLVIEWGNAR